MTQWIKYDYVGYKNGTLVPFRCQTEKSVGDYRIAEERLRKYLCALHKIGNGFDGCSIVLDHKSTERWRRLGWLKRNHYAFTMTAVTGSKSSHRLAVKFITGRMDAEFTGFNPDDADDDTGPGISCDLGFCD